MRNGVPFILTCPEAKVVSFNQTKTNEGVGCMLFTIKNSSNNSLWTCAVFDDDENHSLYKRAGGIQKGSYYFVIGEANQRQRRDGSIEPIIKVTDFYLCHGETTNGTQAINSISGFGR